MPDDFLFQSSRIALQAFESEDVPALKAYLNHPDLAGRRYIPWGFPSDMPLSNKQVEKILEKWSEQAKAAHLAVILPGKQELIGHAFCDWDWDPHSPGLALVINPVYQRQGYGGEVLNMLLRYLFGYTPAHNVSGWLSEWNQAARNFAQKHGFQESGRWRRDGLRRGAYYDGLVVDLLRPEWQPMGEGD